MRDNLKCRGVGFVDKGEFSIKKGVGKRVYSLWSNMMTRCYYKPYHIKYPSYINCFVREDWHSFQNFAIWCNSQKGFHLNYVLDKDILVPNNKMYSKDTCCFVPHDINSIILSSSSRNKSGYPGVSFQKSSGKYIVSCRFNGKNKNLGRYDNKEQAFSIYCSFKESLIKQKVIHYLDTLDYKTVESLKSFNLRERLICQNN